jgi:hypothetical protein
MIDLQKGPSGRIRGLRRLLSGVTRSDILAVLSNFSLEKVAQHGFADSIDFDLVHEGALFPPKAVLGLAAQRVVGRPLTSDEFSGGESSPCFAVLRELGFAIQSKSNGGIASQSSNKARDKTPEEVLGSLQPITAADTDAAVLPEEIPVDTKLIEGAKKTITVNAYERDRTARLRCTAHWGVTCVVCGFDFRRQYGDLGDGFIHVHHLKPLADIGQEYSLDPVADLRPVCPNCHAMLHRGSKVLGIEELRSLLRKDQSNT